MPIKLVNPTTNAEQDFYTLEEVESTATQRTIKVRDEEKSKLYPDIERYRTKAQNLETELATTKTELDKLNQRLQATNGNQPNSADQAEAARLKAEVASLVTRLSDTESKIQTVVDKALETANATFQEQRKKDQLAAKRGELIAAAQGKIIPDLVVGDTVEALTAAADAAKTRYTEIYEAGKAEIELKFKGALPAPVTPGGNANTLGTQGNATVDISALRALSEKDWEAQKAAIKQKAYAETGLPMKVR